MNASDHRVCKITCAVACAFGIAAAIPMAQAANSAQDQRATEQHTQSATAVRNMRASNLIGKEVHNAQNENLGDIKDLVVDLNNGRVHYVVLSFGGFLGLGDKNFAFPMTAFRASGDKDTLILDIDKERLKKAPGFERAKSPDWNNPEYRAQVDRYFGDMYRVQPSANARMVRASELIGKNLDGADGRDAGEIQDLVVSLTDGKVRYAVVSLDKNWGPEDRRYALPLRAFKPGNRMQDDLVLGVNRDAIARAPSFDKNRWPDLNEASWDNQTDRFALAYGAGAMGSAAASNTANTPAADRAMSRGDRASPDRRASNTDQHAATTVRNMRLSQLIGKDVRNAQGENLGDVKDVVVDIGNGRVHYVLLSFGGFLGLGDKVFAYPMRVFQPATDRDELVLNVDKEGLKRAPGFDQARNPDWNRSDDYRAQVDKYFGDTVQVQPRANMILMRGSDLIGKEVNSFDGKDVGEIEDVVVSLRDGAVRYAVVAFDGDWNLGDKRFTMPLNAFRLGQRLQDDFVLTLNRDAATRGPSFDKNRWPDLNSARWSEDVDRYQLSSNANAMQARSRK